MGLIRSAGILKKFDRKQVIGFRMSVFLCLFIYIYIYIFFFCQDVENHPAKACAAALSQQQALSTSLEAVSTKRGKVDRLFEIVTHGRLFCSSFRFPVVF